MLNLNLEKYGRFLLDGVELDCLQLGTGQAERAMAKQSTKGALAQVKPTRVAVNLWDDKASHYTIPLDYWIVNIPAKTGTTYSANIFAKTSPVPTGFTVMLNSEGTRYSEFVGRKVLLNSSGSMSPKQITATHDYLVLGIYVPSGKNVTDVFNAVDIMLVEGTTSPTSYYPFFSPQTVLPAIKTFGKTAKTIVIEGKRYVIPDDIELRDGVFSDTSNYFTTFLDPSQADKWVIDIQFPTSGTRSLIGYSTDTGTYFGKDASDRYELGGNVFITPPPSATDRHTVEFDMTTSTTKLTVEGKSCSRTISSSQTFNFRTVIPGYAATGNNVYSMLAYKGDVLVGAYYPCVKNGVAELYDFVTGKFCTKTGQPTASDKKTKTVRTANLFDETAVTTGEFYNDSGVLTTNAVCYYSDNIPASQGDIITFSRERYVTTVYLRIHAFKSDGTWLAMIGKSSLVSSLSVTSSACPANTAYIVVCGAYASDAIDLHTMVVKGSTAPTQYIPYTLEVPITELWGVGDKTKNLFDKTAVTVGKYLDSTGAAITNAAWAISDYMPVVGGETYYQKLGTPGTAPRTCWYDENKTFISAVAQTSSGTQTAPANAVYCRMCVWRDGFDIAMFTLGSTATPYVPYGYQVDILLGSQGVVDLGTLNWIRQTDGTYPVFRATINAPAISAGNSPIYTTAYSVHPNVVTATYIKTNLLDKTIAYQASSATNQIMVQDSRFTTAAEFKAHMSGKYLYYQRTDDASFIPPTPYTFYTDRQLNAVSTYEDVLTSNNDGTGQISGAMGVYEFTGNEIFTKHASLAGLFFYNIGYLGALVQPTQQNYGLCSHYPAVQVTAGSLSAGECCFQALNGTSNAQFCVRDTNFASVEALQAELRAQAANGTPWKIIFPLATPAVTPLTGLPVIRLTEKTQYTMENTNLVKGDMQAEYLGR